MERIKQWKWCKGKGKVIFFEKDKSDDSNLDHTSCPLHFSDKRAALIQARCQEGPIRLIQKIVF